ncbi:aminoglycoside 6-adenylyltransferase [Cohnella soli]|uniref:Aminoglycoside 6-adenylyltransferase n=1 Tax=Cohnella soli TaxID=425005 RepID=A0ABW0HX02_9BACL
MRSEQEMMDLIINVAKEDERIRAVLMVGSRANPSVSKDKFQDYDITYFVKDVTPFYNNNEWIGEHFGKPVIVQMPENMTLLPPAGDGHFTYLMIFEDGNRIDLSIEFTPYIDDGEPAITLLDKDGFLPLLSTPNDKHWHIKPPTEKLFADCCNEFWWCLNNVGKGIARNELPYTMKMFNDYVRDMLNKMLEWYIGVNTGFSVSAGKLGKYFKKYLPADLYEMYLNTYSNADYDNLWTSVFTACDLFHTAALHVAEHSGYSYNQSEENGMIGYLNKIRSEKMI